MNAVERCTLLDRPLLWTGQGEIINDNVESLVAHPRHSRDGHLPGHLLYDGGPAIVVAPCLSIGG